MDKNKLSQQDLVRKQLWDDVHLRAIKNVELFYTPVYREFWWKNDPLYFAAEKRKNRPYPLTH